MDGRDRLAAGSRALARGEWAAARDAHEVYGTPWGHDLVAFLATHPEALQEFGFQSFGDLAANPAAHDPSACPPDL
jgi:hypothetical protein